MVLNTIYDATAVAFSAVNKTNLFFHCLHALNQSVCTVGVVGGSSGNSTEGRMLTVMPEMELAKRQLG